MYNYLIEHALRNVWCTPDQDTQSRVQLAKLTPAEGVWSRVRIMWREYILPVPMVRFHVYQIGQIHPLLMGLLAVKETWTTLAESCNAEKMIVDLFTANGVEFPRTESWFMVTRDKNLIVAVKAQPKIDVDLGAQPLFMRVYSNSYFNSDRSDPLDDFVRVEGRTVSTRNQILALQDRYDYHAALPGLTYAFVNGRKVHTINLFTVKIDDIVEFVYDSSIYKTVDFPVADLLTFQSTLDRRLKYLLHVPKDDTDNIDYQDDIDVFLLEPNTTGGHRGVYYHRNSLDAMRNLTHRDYSVPVANLLSFVANSEQDLNRMFVRLHFRRSGWQRPLVNEHNRIKELYKLPDVDIRKAMVGVDAVVPNWTADTLESSAYTEIMRAQGEQVNADLVERAYGYNAIAKLIGDTPNGTRRFSGMTLVDVPYALQQNSCVWEYDAEGKLLGAYNHVSGAIYGCTWPTCARVEILSGLYSEVLEQFYGDTEVTLLPGLNYRFYTAPIQGGIVGKVWTDVTNSGQYAVVGDKAKWLINQVQYQTLVRTDSRVLAYSFTLAPTDGIYVFDLINSEKRGGVTSRRVMEILLGELDIFMNGYSLIAGLDYIRVGVRIVVISKRFLQNPGVQAQRFTVRFSGFCRPDGTPEPYMEYGFVSHGLLSRNRRYDIRDDKVLRIVAGGRVHDRSELQFSESDSGVYPQTLTNGTPYQIRDIVVPMRSQTPSDTYLLRARSMAVDRVISDYLTVKIPEPVISGPSVIPERYELISPFVQKLIADLRDDLLDDPRIYGHFNDTDVREICRRYEYLLAFDPTQPLTQVDERYVVVLPHSSPNVVDLSIYQERFLARAVTVYCNGLVNLSPFIRVEKF